MSTRTRPWLVVLAMTLSGCGQSASSPEPLVEAPPDQAPAQTDRLTDAPNAAESVAAVTESSSPAALPDSVPTEPVSEPTPEPVSTDPFASATPTEGEQPESTRPATQTEPDNAVGRGRLDRDLAELQVPPPWLASVEPAWDMSKPWKEARQEIRRLLGVNKESARREGIKLLWEYHNRNDIGDGHEYGFDLFLGGESAWAIKEFQAWLPLQTEYLFLRGWTALASLYVEYGEYERAEEALETVMTKVSDHEYPLMRAAEVHDSLGDLYVSWDKADKAKHHYSEAVRLYPQGKPKYGRHLLPRRAKKVQAKLDLLSFGSLANVSLKDGRYREKALGYSGDINLTVVVKQGRVSDITLTHQEKIDQNACVIIPRRVVEEQSLKVDGITGATITKDAIVGGAFQALKQAGLK